MAKATAKKPAAKKAVAIRTKAKHAVAKKPVRKAPAKPAAAKPAPTAVAKRPATPAPAKVDSKKSHKKEKTIRDSFNMPATDYALIATLKAQALKSGRAVKKSELLRAGIRLLANMDSAAFASALAAVPAVKTGRPAGKK